MEVLYGLHPVEEALKAGRRRFDHVMVARERDDPRMERLLAQCREAGVRVRQESREQLTLVAQSPTHQGIVAFVRPQESLSIEDLFEPGAAAKAGGARMLLALDGVEDPQNLGALLRVADGAGVDGVVLTERRSAPLSAVAVKASAGAAEHLRIARVVNLVRALEDLKRHNLWIIGLDERGTTDYDGFDFSGNCVLVLGREGAGLHELVRRTCDHLLRIPMAGGVSSLNVSTAGAVVLYEAFRQRRIGFGQGRGRIGRRSSHAKTAQTERPGLMKFSIARTAFLSVTAAVAGVSLLGQSHDPPPPATQTAPQQESRPGGQVIFSRSTDENGETTTKTGPAAQQPTPRMVNAPTADDGERQAVTFIAYDMDVHLHTAAQQIAVRALVTVRNDGKSALAQIPLQISSSLNWERIRVLGRDVNFQVATLNSDVDHTGQLHEAAVPLGTPLGPGESIQIDVTYSGAIAQSAERLLTIGTPNDVALHSDWDGIGVPFTGLRGFGNVAWYPVSSVPVILGDGARVFDEMGEHKLRMDGRAIPPAANGRVSARTGADGGI